MKRSASHPASAFWAPVVVPLPLLGEQHPLNCGYRRSVVHAATLAMLVHLTFGFAWTTGRMARQETAIGLPDRPRTRIEWVSPAPIDETRAPGTNVAWIAEVALPIPVPDYKAVVLTVAGQEEIGNSYPLPEPELYTDPVEPPVIQVDTPERTPSPSEHVVYEEMPVLVSIPAPVYPEMARQAGVDGIVFVQALIGRDGRVQEARVVQGNEMLREPALAAAKAAVFKPASERGHAVPVWIVVPIRFSLQ